jgi:hypothetical protein
MKWCLLILVLIAGALLAGCCPCCERSPATAAFTHVVTVDTPYYTAGPQQARPPDGTFQAQTKVNVLRDAGSYCQVKAENGVTAYVSTAALKKLSP